MTSEERESLLTYASELVHLHMLYAGLNRIIDNQRHDQLCEEMAQKVYRLIDEAVNDEFTAIETRKQQKELCDYFSLRDCECGALIDQRRDGPRHKSEREEGRVV